MLLCAGLGTRLRPLTDELPKPLVPLGDRPLLAHVLERLSEGGITRAVMNSHHLHHEFLHILRQLPRKPQVSHESEILGTAGGVAHARQLLGKAPLVVHNGDILCRPPVAPLLERARTGGMWLAVAARPPGQGTIGLDDEARVVRLRGGQFGSETRGGDYIGVASLGADVLEALPARGCLIGDVALPRLRSGQVVGAVLVEGGFIDCGHLVSYFEANLAWLEERGERAFVGKDAVVDGVELERTVVGAGARVTGSGRLERVVVWPGATARAPLSDMIVTSRGQLVNVQGR
jgi:mannose-1-phosphate guanylyltransferase